MAVCDGLPFSSSSRIICFVLHSAQILHESATDINADCCKGAVAQLIIEILLLSRIERYETFFVFCGTWRICDKHVCNRRQIQAKFSQICRVPQITQKGHQALDRAFCSRSKFQVIEYLLPTNPSTVDKLRRIHMRTRKLGFAAAIVVICAAVVYAQSKTAGTKSGYLTPPKVVVDILDAPPTPTVIVSPDHHTIAVL